MSQNERERLERLLHFMDALLEWDLTLALGSAEKARKCFRSENVEWYGLAGLQGLVWLKNTIRHVSDAEKQAQIIRDDIAEMLDEEREEKQAL